MYCILHISDLHRSRAEPLDNDSLIAALLADRDRYIGETPFVPSPDAIIVSGDIVQGALIGQVGWEAAVQDQYRVATEFLDSLTRRFLDGDRSRIVIVPGNHDVCWNTSIASMRPVPEDEHPPSVIGALTEPDSLFRWSWKELRLYKIVDIPLYQRRTDAYWQFVEAFYEGVALPTSIDRHRGYQLFELANRRIVVAAFDSIASNDCLGYSGSMARGTVSRCDLELRDRGHLYDLRLAVWHHGLQGPPTRDDYMDVTQIHEMAGLHFQLGLHGHQHVAAASTHYVHLSQEQSMAVVSAGSLCAGARELPRGVDRQYNLVVIEDDFLGARVHVREMGEGGQFTRQTRGAFSQGFVRINWQAALDVMGRPVDALEENSRQAVLHADQAFSEGDPRRALDLLREVELTEHAYARALSIQCAVRLEDWPFLIQLLAEPQSAEEEVHLVAALVHVNQHEEAKVALLRQIHTDAATRQALTDQIDARILTGTR